jgi:uncharacterized protein with PQ loop repeat
MDLTQALTLAAAGLTLVAGMPQLWRMLRTSAAGVSAATWATLAGVGALWTVWSLAAGVWPMVVSEGCFTVCSALIAVRCTSRGRATALGVSTLGGLCAVWWLGGPAALGVGAVAGSVACRIPQLRAAWREPDVAGVSAGSWLLLLGSNVLWAWAGIVRHDPVLVAGGVLSAVVSVVVVVLARVRGARRLSATPV